MSLIKKFLAFQVPQIEKGISYARALKVVALVLVLPETILVFAFLLKVISYMEVVQASLFLGGLSFVGPLVLRLNEKKLLVGLLAGTVLIFSLIAMRHVCDAYYVRQVLSAYIDGGILKENAVLKWIASSSSRSYTHFFIDQVTYLRKCAQKVVSFKSQSEESRKMAMIELRMELKSRYEALGNVFMETGYSNMMTVVQLKMLQSQYEKLLNSLQEVVTITGGRTPDVGL